MVSGGPGYFGDDAFLKGHTTGFEGTAADPQTVVPEPATAVLLIWGFAGIGLTKKIYCQK